MPCTGDTGHSRAALLVSTVLLYLAGIAGCPMDQISMPTQIGDYTEIGEDETDNNDLVGTGLDSPATLDDFGNDPSTAKMLSDGETVRGEIGVAGDVDFFAFAAAADTQYRIGFSGSNTTGLRVLDVTGQDTLARSVTGRETDVDFSPPQPGTYFIELSCASTGSYELTVRRKESVPDPTDDPTPDPDPTPVPHPTPNPDPEPDPDPAPVPHPTPNPDPEPDPDPAPVPVPTDDHANSVNGATTIAVGETVAGSMESGGDVDFFSFASPADWTYAIETQGRTDTRLTLLDSDGTTVIATNDDDGSGRNALIRWESRVAGTYFIVVRHQNEGALGEYDLVLRGADAIFIAEDFGPNDEWDVAGGMDDPDLAYNQGDELWHYDSATREHIHLFDIDSSSGWTLFGRAPQVSADGAYASCRGAGDASSQDVVYCIETSTGQITQQYGAKDGIRVNDPQTGGVSDIGFRNLVFASGMNWGWDSGMRPEGCNERKSTAGFHSFPPPGWWQVYFAIPGNPGHWYQHSQAFIHGGRSNCSGPEWGYGNGTHHEVWWTTVDNTTFEHTLCEAGHWWIGAYVWIRSTTAEIQLLSDSPMIGYDSHFFDGHVGVSDDDHYIAYVGVARDGSSRHGVIVWDVEDSCNSARLIRSTPNSIGHLSVSGGANDFIVAWAEAEPRLFWIAPRDGDAFPVHCPGENDLGSIHARRIGPNRIRAMMRTKSAWLDGWLWIQDFSRDAAGVWQATAPAVKLDDVVKHPDWRPDSAGGGRLTPNGRRAIVRWGDTLYRVGLPDVLQ